MCIMLLVLTLLMALSVSVHLVSLVMAGSMEVAVLVRQIRLPLNLAICLIGYNVHAYGLRVGTVDTSYKTIIPPKYLLPYIHVVYLQSCDLSSV